jgi:Ser/Thr protein kinase RdoA (MazF antagonist)
MTPQEALELINASSKTDYSLDLQFSGGEDQGAFQVVKSDGTHAVLKLNRNPLWVNQIKRAKAATDHLRGLGYPVPTYITFDATDRGTYSLQTELPGTSLEPTVDVINQLTGFIELQKGQTISEVQGQDWVWYMNSVVFRGEFGNVRALMQYSPETSALVADIEGLVAGLDGKMLPQTDLVHGDMGVRQVLVLDGKVTGVVDWDQAGYGDRTMDLASLWYSLLAYAEPRDAVMQHMLEVADKDTIKIYAAYKMLSLIAWNINKVGGDVTQASNEARQALGLLRQL